MQRRGERSCCVIALCSGNPSQAKLFRTTGVTDSKGATDGRATKCLVGAGVLAFKRKHIDGGFAQVSADDHVVQRVKANFA